jgi:signal transduction histidine kinase
MTVFPTKKPTLFTYRLPRLNSMNKQSKFQAGKLGRHRPGAVEGAGSFSRYSSALLLFLVFCVVILVGVVVILDVRSTGVEAQKMYAGSVLGLHRIGDLQYAAQETRRSTFYALSTNDSNLQVKYADQSREADHLVIEGVSEYLREAKTPVEMEAGKRLQNDWSAYLKVRDEVLASILEGSTKEAVDLDLKDGVPLFDRVREDLEAIERLYDDQASQRLANVAASSKHAMTRLFGVLGTTLVFAIVSVWAIQRNRMQSAIQLAKLQMEFVASVSHELRTPLTVISSAADNIADGLVEGKEEIKNYGSAIRYQSHQMTELVNEILLFASTKDRKNAYVLRPLKVSDLVDAVLVRASELIKGAGFTIDVQIDAELPCVVGDMSALAQCLQNLLINAVKYSGQSRWIGVRAFVSDSDVHNSKKVCIAVQDRGIGIHSSELPHIFEPFYRSAAVTAEQIHGTGLGLSLSKTLAEAMGGEISVISELEVGSVFTLHLQIAEGRKLPIAGLTSGVGGTVKK